MSCAAPAHHICIPISITAPVVVDIPLFFAVAEVVDVLYALAHQVRLGLVDFVDEDLEQVAAVDVVLAGGLAQEYQVFFAGKLFGGLDGHLAVERALGLDLRLLSGVLQLAVLLEAHARSWCSWDAVDEGQAVANTCLMAAIHPRVVDPASPLRLRHVDSRNPGRPSRPRRSKCDHALVRRRHQAAVHSGFPGVARLP